MQRGSVGFAVEELMCEGCVSLSAWRSSEAAADAWLTPCTRLPPLRRDVGARRGERSAQTHRRVCLPLLPSWNSSLNFRHMKSTFVEIRSSRGKNREVQVVRKTLISLVAPSRLGFVTLSPSWLAVDRSLSCLRLCDPPSAFCSQNSF